MRANLPESTLEEFVVTNLQSIFGTDATLVGRQVRLRSGRVPDVVFTQGRAIVVVEVKAQRIDRQAVCQLLEYMGELDRSARYAPPHSPPYTVEGVVAAPSITDRAATMLQCLPGVRYLELVPLIEVATDLINRARLWAHCGPDSTNATDILPDDNDIAVACRLAEADGIRRAHDRFADYLLSEYLWFYEEGQLYSNWNPPPSMPVEAAEEYVASVERKLATEYPGRNTRPLLAP